MKIKRIFITCLIIVTFTLCLCGCSSDTLTDRSVKKIIKQNDEIAETLDISSVTIKATKDLHNSEYDTFVLIYGKTKATNEWMYLPVCINTQEKQSLSVSWAAPLSIIMQEVLLNGSKEANLAIFDNMADFIRDLGFDYLGSEENAAYFTNDITAKKGIIDVQTARSILAEPLMNESGEYLRENIEVFFEPGMAIPKYLAIKSSGLVYNWESLLPESAYETWKAVTERDVQRFMQAEYGPPYVMADVWTLKAVKPGADGIEGSILGHFASIEQIKATLYVDDSETISTELVMGTTSDFPPYGFLDEENNYVGIDVEIAREIAQKIGLQLKIVEAEFSNIPVEVQSGKYDIGMSALTATEERKEIVDFTTPYATNIQSVIVSINSELTTLEDLAGKRIGVQQNTTGDIYASETPAAGGFGEDKVIRYKNAADAVADLGNGAVDCVIIDREQADSLAQANSGLKILDDDYSHEVYAICVAKNNQGLLKRINEILDELITDGTVKSIVDKYRNVEEHGKIPVKTPEIPAEGYQSNKKQIAESMTSQASAAE